jgi:MFS family permease
MGWVCDKIHPVRLTAVSVFFMIVCAVLSFFFVQGKVSLTVLWVVLAPAPAGYNIGMQAAGVLLLPKEKYGQFTSAMGIVTALAAGAGNILAGFLFDAIPYYRMFYLWYTVCETVALVAAIAVWIQWKKHGGAKHFVVPEME